MTNNTKVKVHMVLGTRLNPSLDTPVVDLMTHRSIMGSLLYLTVSRPDIMFIVCNCDMYQSNPKNLISMLPKTFVAISKERSRWSYGIHRRQNSLYQHS